MQYKYEIAKISEMRQYKTLNNLSKWIIFLAWTELISATILVLFTYKNSQILGEALTIVLYGLAGFVFFFAIGKILTLLIDIRKHHELKFTRVSAESDAYREFMLNELHDIIEKQKSSLFRRKYRDNTISVLNVLIPSRKDAIEVIKTYRSKFSKNITSELEGLTSSYNLKMEYLKKFVDYGLVEEEYPHRLYEDFADRE